MRQLEASLRRKQATSATSSETSITVDERPYGLTKAALNSLVQGLAYRYVNEGYRINAVAPGVTVSDMVGAGTDGNLTYNYNITDRYYLPEEVKSIFLVPSVLFSLDLLIKH